MKFLAGNFAPDILSQLRNYAKLMRLDRPIGIWLLLWPTLWALWLAGEGHPDPGLFVIFVLGVVVMMLVCIVRGLEGERFKIPMLGELADRL